ncbi:hypothetical protein ACU8MI_16665 [Rhizobium leguminosarum]
MKDATNSNSPLPLRDQAPDGSLIRDGALSSELLLTAIAAWNRQEAKRSVVEAVDLRLSSPLRPTTREVWLRLVGAFYELELPAFISERTFYRRVAEERARRRTRGRKRIAAKPVFDRKPPHEDA